MEKDVLQALYYIRKNQILQFYKLNPEKSGYSKSYIYMLFLMIVILCFTQQKKLIYIWIVFQSRKSFFMNLLNILMKNVG